MTTNSFYWYDYETTGLNPASDRVLQFAGLRTNLDLEPIDEPQMFYCQLSPDCLPSIEASLVTGISPQISLSQGIAEPQFINKIQQEMSKPGTCVVGYNNISFDDEFTRNLLYRNFFEPYAREYGQNRSRWDILNMVRMTAALRPNGINWANDSHGLPVFKLTALTTANNIEHQHAHDALGDVYATIALAKLIKQKQPQLFDYLFNKIRDKNQVKDFLYKTQSEQQMCVYTSTQLPKSQAYTSLMHIIGSHPWDNNRVLALDLMQDPRDLFARDVNELQQALFEPSDKHIKPKGLCSIKINASPALAPIGVFQTLNTKAIAGLNINIEQCQQHQQLILQQTDLLEKLQQVYDRHYPEQSDPELAIYQGFLKYKDKQVCTQVRNSTAIELSQQVFNFIDQRLPTLLLRYRARHYPESLNYAEQKIWRVYGRERLGLDNGKFDAYMQHLKQLQTQQTDLKLQQVLKDLVIYAETQARYFS